MFDPLIIWDTDSFFDTLVPSFEVYRKRALIDETVIMVARQGAAAVTSDQQLSPDEENSILDKFYGDFLKAWQDEDDGIRIAYFSAF
jgi:hypothetical protein